MRMLLSMATEAVSLHASRTRISDIQKKPCTPSLDPGRVVVYRLAHEKNEMRVAIAVKSRYHQQTPTARTQNVTTTSLFLCEKTAYQDQSPCS